MDNQSVANGQIPQFDPTATPPPPSGSVSGDQKQAPGMVVEPSQSAPIADSLAALEQTVNQPEAPNLPPPPFENPSTNGPSIQPTMPSNPNPMSPAPADNADSVQQFSLPTAQAPVNPVEPAETSIDDIVQSQLSASPESTLPTEDNSAESELPVEEPVSEPEPQADAEPEQQAEETATDTDSGKTGVVDPAAAREAEGPLELIKQQALRELAPIANQLDQEPVERFHTLLELIQATDNHDLVQGAFDSAQAIKDDKERATALLNLVNEVSYLEKLEESDSDDSAESED